MDRSQISGWGIYSREVRNVVFKNGNATSQFNIEPSPAADSLTMHVGQARQHPGNVLYWCGSDNGCERRVNSF